ncbi:MAG: tetratricopeptide repeat protein, partial [Clostridiales bacterium]|nr:tetratricopeptide repeat protein [Clostridiales bacterium]
SGGTGYQSAYQQQSYQNSRSGSGTVYQQVRQFINMGYLDQAERLLNRVGVQDAEWHFLMGSVVYRRGWLDEARQHFQIACNNDPANPEYRQALNMMMQGGHVYRPAGFSGQMDSCDICTTMMCLNCLCGGCR